MSIRSTDERPSDGFVSHDRQIFPDATADGPLAECLVADFTENLPGPMASMLLRQLGATVVKVERPGGETGRRHPIFSWIAAGKRSVELDLKTAEGRSTAFALAARADVVMEGFRPGVADRLGFGFDAVATDNPGVVYCSLSGFGQTGERRAQPGHDLTYLAESGLLYDHRDADDDQVLVSPPGLIADNTSGLLAAVAILGRLAAPKPRLASHLDVALSDGALVPSLASMAVMLAGNDAQFVGLEEFPHYRLFATSDHRHLAIGITPWEQPFWDNLCIALEQHDLVGLSAGERHDRSPELVDRLTGVFGSDTLTGWQRRLAGVDAPWAPVRTAAEAAQVADASGRPVLRRDDRVVDLLQTGERGTVPAVGEANDALARWLREE